MPSNHLNPPTFNPSQLKRFWAKVPQHLSISECWVWTGMRMNEYGLFRFYRPDGSPSGNYGAHRIVHFLKTGEWPEAVCHHCDNPPCVNPCHLFGGTRDDNNQDRIAKGRTVQVKGVDSPFAKLTEAQVLFAKKAWKTKYNKTHTRPQIAKMFGVSVSVIAAATNPDPHLRKWKHLDFAVDTVAVQSDGD